MWPGILDARIGAWIAHAQHADTWRLRHAIFEGGWYQPRWGSAKRPGPSMMSMAGAAMAPGTTAALVLGDAWAPAGAARSWTTKEPVRARDGKR
ncbi:MAG: hypothetical protein L0Y60_03295 [Beijerinckiaceae bacterium]|nr:hypothetical protein [Beijerinckiaceae bacterium]